MALAAYVTWLTLVLEPWLDFAFLALGDSTAAVRADRDEDDEDEDSVRPPALPQGPPRRWPPPEKGMKGAEGAEEEDGWEFSPDGPASSPSSGFPLSTGDGTFGRTASWEFGTSSCWTGSVLLGAEAGAGAGWASIGIWGVEFLIGTCVVDVSGCDGAGSGWGDGLGVVSLATGVVGIAAVSVASPPSSSPCGLFFLSKNLKKRQ